MRLKRFVGAALAALMVSGALVASPVQAAEPLPKVPVPASKAKVGSAKDVTPKGAVKGRTPKAGGVSTRALTTCSPDACFKYSGVGQTFSDNVASVRYDLSIHKPQLSVEAGAYQNNWHDQKGRHSLMEVSAAAPGTTGGGQGNTVEAGWTVDYNINSGSFEPHFFVHMWIDNDPMGYNMDPNAGFNDFSGGGGFSPIGPGDALTGAIGTSKRFQLAYLDNTASGGMPGWWVGYNSLWVGYWPETMWSNEGETFLDASEVQGFGEIATFTDESCTDMGSGTMAAAGVGASISNYAVTGTTDTPDIDNFTSGTDLTRWNRVGTASPIYIGGPGHNAIGMALGTTGSCGPNTPGTSVAGAFQFWQEHAPDNTIMYPTLAGTGASNMVNYSAAGLVIGACHQLLNWGSRETWAIHNNANVSGRSVQIYKTSNCTGSSLIFNNQGKAAFPSGGGWEKFNIRTFKRIS